jgi:hypothetical protein
MTFNKSKLKYATAFVVGVYAVYLAAVGLISSPSSELYTPPVLDEQASDHDKALIMATACTKALDDELGSLFGWLPNDLMLVPTIIDNTTAYQKGVIYATRPASDILAKTVARFGNNDTTDPRLADATSRFFTYSEKVWGFWFVYDAEGKYKAGIKNWLSWAESIGTPAKNAGIYNVKSDDVYLILKYCDSMCDYALGILNDDKTGHFDADDDIYYVKGVAAVVTNVLRGLIAVDNSIIERGGKENVDECLKRLEYISEFNPLYVVAGGNALGDAMLPNHIASLARHFDVANNRIEDIMEAMAK